jgi:hypothetical protein
VDKDAKKTIALAGVAVPIEKAKTSAQIVAHALVQTRMPSLERHALGQIQNWRNHDEKIVTTLRRTRRPCRSPRPWRAGSSRRMRSPPP